MSLTPELRWVMLRAFGPIETAAPAGVDLAVAAELAARLGVAPRIGARARYASELAEAPAISGALARASAQAAATQLRARESAAEVAVAAVDAAVPCCFLKGLALEASGALLPGGRPLADVDVLVPVDATARLGAALAQRGFQPGAGEEYPHQLPAFQHPQLGSVEVHRHLPGVAVPPSSRFATFDDVAAAGWLVQWHELAPGASRPAPHVVVAHALAHALAQHGFSPSAYPQLRLLADLIDLGIAGDDGESLLAAALPLVERWVPAEEVNAAGEACRLLSTGRPTDLDGDAPAVLLLRHMLAGALDERYLQALKLEALAHPLHQGKRLAGWWAAARQALVLSPAQVDRIYGPQRSRWGYRRWRLLRPLDLLRRWLVARRARR
ncbi:MAG TPA: nucleotidyltransferase family protein [Thermoanaerobaculia bacterium]|nr:nucleotidyltransferase family protein [Thermoanaerobaculia bacterium]